MIFFSLQRDFSINLVESSLTTLLFLAFYDKFVQLFLFRIRRLKCLKFAPQELPENSFH